MVARGEFLEYARVFGKHSYGTPKKWLEESRRKGIDLVLEIDVQGAAQVKQKLPESVAIFILPPSRQELERRLRSRGMDADDEIARRLAKAKARSSWLKSFTILCGERRRRTRGKGSAGHCYGAALLECPAGRSREESSGIIWRVRHL